MARVILLTLKSCHVKAILRGPARISIPLRELSLLGVQCTCYIQPNLWVQLLHLWSCLCQTSSYPVIVGCLLISGPCTFLDALLRQPYGCGLNHVHYGVFPSGRLQHLDPLWDVPSSIIHHPFIMLPFLQSTHCLMCTCLGSLAAIFPHIMKLREQNVLLF